MKNSICVLMVAGLTLSSIGCGGGNTAPVSGVVTLDGQPVYPARVSFAPQASEGNMEASGRLSSAMTGPDGSYSIDEAALGENKVSVIMLAADEDSEEAEDNETPAPAGKLEKTMYTVESGGNTIDLKMTAPPASSGKKRGRGGRGRNYGEDD